MKLYSEKLGQNNFTWDNYGERYCTLINKII